MRWEWKIDWTYEGRTDAAFGTGATPVERLLGLGAALIFTGLIVLLNKGFSPQETPWWRLAALAFLGFDVAGGVTANMLNSAKRFYHARRRNDEGPLIAIVKIPVLFTAVHVHPIIAASLFGGDWRHGAVWYGLILVAVIVTQITPLYLRRPVAASLATAIMVTSLYALPLAEGLEWLIPCLALKLILAHGVREEPYRPA